MKSLQEIATICSVIIDKECAFEHRNAGLALFYPGKSTITSLMYIRSRAASLPPGQGAAHEMLLITNQGKIYNNYMTKHQLTTFIKVAWPNIRYTRVYRTSQNQPIECDHVFKLKLDISQRLEFIMSYFS